MLLALSTRYLSTAALVSFVSFVGSTSLSAGTIKVPSQQPTIAAAIGAAAPGDTILLKQGVYEETISLSFTDDLRFKAKGKVVLDAGGAPYGVSTFICNDLRFEGITFRNAGTAAVFIQAGIDARFERCVFEGGGSDGLMIHSGQNHEVLDCKFKDIPRYGLDLQAASSRVAGCRFVDCASGGGWPAVRLNGDHHTFEGNVLIGGGAAAAIGIGVFGGSASQMLVADNVIVGAVEDGILLGDATNCTILENVIRKVGGDGVDLNIGADGNLIGDNRVVKAGKNGVETSGNDNSFLRNRVKKSAADGLWVSFVSDRGYWFKNKVKRAGGNGLDVSGEDNTFVGNVAKKSAGFDLSDPAPLFNEYSGNAFGTIEP